MLCWTYSKMLCSIISASTLGYKCFAVGWLNIPHRLSVTSVAATAANFNVMFLLWLKLPQQPNLNVIERKFKRQILMPDPIILGHRACCRCWQMVVTSRARGNSDMPLTCWLIDTKYLHSASTYFSYFIYLPILCPYDRDLHRFYVDDKYTHFHSKVLDFRILRK